MEVFKQLQDKKLLISHTAQSPIFEGEPIKHKVTLSGNYGDIEEGLEILSSQFKYILSAPIEVNLELVDKTSITKGRGK